MEAYAISPQKLYQWVDGLIPERVQEDMRQRRKARSMIISYFLTGIFLSGFATLYHLIDYDLGVWACMYGAAVIPILLFTFSRSGNFALTGAIFDLNAMVMFALLIYGTGGIDSSIVPWLAIIPASGFAFEGWRRGTLMSGLSLIAVVALAVVNGSGTAFPILYDPDKQVVLDLTVNIGLLLYIFMILLLHEMGKEKRLDKMDVLYARLRADKKKIEEQEEALAYSFDRISNINGKFERSVAEQTQGLETAMRESDQFWEQAIQALRSPVQEAWQVADGLQEVGGTAQQQVPRCGDLVKRVREINGTLEKLMTLVAVNRQDFQREMVNPEAVFAQELVRKAETINTRRIRIDVHQVGPAEFVSDLDLVRQVLVCLLENAIAFSSLTTPAPQVRVELETRSEGLEIHMRDNRMEVLKAALDAGFSQGEAQGKGSQLALYVARKIAEDIGGRFEIRHEEEEWNEVRVFLPSL